MTNTEFRALLNLMMVSDPWPLSKEENDILEHMLDTEARVRGYDGWIVAYHEMPRR